MKEFQLLTQSLASGWRQGRQYWYSFLAASLIYFSVSYGPLLVDWIWQLPEMAAFLLGLTCGFLSVILDIGLMGLAMDISAGRKVRFERLFHYSRYLLPLLGLSAAAGIPLLMVLLLCWKLTATSQLAYLALAVIGVTLVYAGVRCSLLICVLAEKEIGLVAGLLSSWRMTKGYFLPLAVLQLLLWLLGLLGLALLGVGYLLAVPVVVFSLLAAYRYLQEAAPAAEDSAAGI